MEFLNKRTVEQFKTAKQTSKIFFNLAVKGSKETGYSPITYKDAAGNDTGVQKVFITDTAGNTISWCAMAVAKDLQSGGLKGEISFMDIIDDNGEPHVDRCCYSSSQSEARTITSM